MSKGEGGRAEVPCGHSIPGLFFSSLQYHRVFLCRHGHFPFYTHRLDSDGKEAPLACLLGVLQSATKGAVAVVAAGWGRCLALRTW